MPKLSVNKDGSIRRYRYVPYSKSGSPFETWDEYQEWNETQPCINPACTRRRYGRAKYCCVCTKYATAFGDPRYRPVKRKQYRKWEDLAKDMIRFNSSNILVTDFCDKLTTIVDHARQGFSVEYGSWYKHLHDIFNHHVHMHRRKPVQYLAELAGIYCFYSETANEFIKSERMWYWQLGTIMLTGVKGKVRPRATGKRTRKFGVSVWQIFSPYLLPVAHATHRNEVMKNERAKKIAEAKLNLPSEAGLDDGETY